MIRVERRLTQPRWLAPAVPLVSLVVAFGVMTLILLATHHAPGPHLPRGCSTRGSSGRRI